MTHPRRLALALFTSVALAAGSGACGAIDAPFPPGGNAGGSSGTDSGGGEGGDTTTLSGGPSGSGGNVMQGLFVEPATDQTLVVTTGENPPTLSFEATVNGSPVNVGWGVDRGEIGKVTAGPAASTTFTPTARAGGVVTLVAAFNDELVERRVQVQLRAAQNGPDSSHAGEQAQIATSVEQLTEGGGVGGVGGEGLGVPVSNPATLAALDAPASDGSAEGLSLLYPYDGTVFPRGMLAPLLMWDGALEGADAVKIELETTSGSFRYEGTFGRPAILAESAQMVRHPIPQGAWEMATDSAGDATLDGEPDKLVMRLTLAKDGVGYGPLTRTWIVAPGRLSGTIYYNSYGTNLAKNYPGAQGGDGTFGGAVLSIKVGDTGPALVAGTSGPSSACRVCHSVAADGSRLIAQNGDNNSLSSGYAITPEGVTEQQLATGSEFPGIAPDGNLALTPGGQLIDLTAGGTPVAVSGLAEWSTNLGTPAFSPAGDKVVFNPAAGPGIDNPMQKLVVISFDAASNTFASPVEVVDNTGMGAQVRPGWGAFLPDGNSVVYQQQLVAGSDGNNHNDLRTRKGAKAYIAWAPADGSSEPIPLDKANGAGYLPQLAEPITMTCTGDGVQVGGMDNDHADDVNLNYEPTVNPVASGGYAWVVITSRRMYGSVANIPPFCSDPRGVDLIENITPKKLWVAAIDLNAPAGQDPSHPAFYLPAQELLAGNARGFWVLDPCKTDGQGCETGDQCCNGFCSPSGEGDDDELVCSPTPSGDCSMPQEKCETAADCCNPTNLCINGFCAVQTPK